MVKLALIVIYYTYSSKNKRVELFKSIQIVAIHDTVNLSPNSAQNVADEYFIQFSE